MTRFDGQQEHCPSQALLDQWQDAYSDDVVVAQAAQDPTGLSFSWRKLRAILGYRSPAAIARFGKEHGIELTKADLSFAGGGGDGLVGLAKRRPDPPTMSRRHAPGNQVCLDPVSMPVPQYGGSMVAFVMVDPGLGLVTVHGTTTKSTSSVIESLLEFVRRSRFYQESERGFPKCVRSDAESIFLSKEFLTFLRARGASSEIAPGYHHRHNHAVESLIGVLFSSAMAMFFSSAIVECLGEDPSQRFFLLALQHAATLHNYLRPESGLASPYERDTGQPPPVHRLVAEWGSACKVVLSREQRNTKISAKVKNGYFLGVSPYHDDCFSVYVPGSRQVLEVFDVYFDADAPPPDGFLPIVGEDDVLEDLVVENLRPPPERTFPTRKQREDEVARSCDNTTGPEPSDTALLPTDDAATDDRGGNPDVTELVDTTVPPGEGNPDVTELFDTTLPPGMHRHDHGNSAATTDDTELFDTTLPPTAELATTEVTAGASSWWVGVSSVVQAWFGRSPPSGRPPDGIGAAVSTAVPA